MLSFGDIFGLLFCLGGLVCLFRFGGKWFKRWIVEDRVEGCGGWLGGRGRCVGGGFGCEFVGVGEVLVWVFVEVEREVWVDFRVGLGF